MNRNDERPHPALSEFPWEVHHRFADFPAIYSSGGWLIAEFDRTDIADFIVRACNEQHARETEAKQ
jgi:hypothetical protein